MCFAAFAVVHAIFGSSLSPFSLVLPPWLLFFFGCCSRLQGLSLGQRGDEISHKLCVPVLVYFAKEEIARDVELKQHCAALGSQGHVPADQWNVWQQPLVCISAQGTDAVNPVQMTPCAGSIGCRSGMGSGGKETPEGVCLPASNSANLRGRRGEWQQGCTVTMVHATLSATINTRRPRKGRQAMTHATACICPSPYPLPNASCIEMSTASGYRPGRTCNAACARPLVWVVCPLLPEGLPNASKVLQAQLVPVLHVKGQERHQCAASLHQGNAGLCQCSTSACTSAACPRTGTSKHHCTLMAHKLTSVSLKRCVTEVCTRCNKVAA